MSADCYCGTLSLRWPFFAKGLGYFAKVLSFCMKIPGIVHPAGQLFMAVHLVGYRSLPILRSVFYLSLNPWEAHGWQVIAVNADVKQVITSWLQTFYKCLYPGIWALVPLWGKCKDGSGDCFEVWCVPSASHVPCIDQSHNNILTWEWFLPYCLKDLYIHNSLSMWFNSYYYYYYYYYPRYLLYAGYLHLYSWDKPCP